MANLITCGGCGGPVSSEAPTCPRCGHPIKAAPVAAAKAGSAKGKVMLVLVALVVVGAVMAAQDKEKSRKEVASPDTNTKIVDVTAKQLQLDYEANEVRADELYKGQVLRVTGVIQSIKKDISDDPYVVLETNNQFMGAHAKFADEKALGALSVGKVIGVRCRGANVILGSPMLKDCVLE